MGIPFDPDIPVTLVRGFNITCKTGSLDTAFGVKYNGILINIELYTTTCAIQL